MKKHYMIATSMATYRYYCTEEEALARLQHFAKVYRDVSLHEVTDTCTRQIKACHR